MYVNGIVIQKYANNSYKGIDGSGFSTGQNWYFNYDEELCRLFEPFFDEHINRTYHMPKEHTWVSACTDMDYINSYIAESKKRGIKYRLLLCESEIPNPLFDASGFKTKFLGYDYAYETDDYYSAVYNEIPSVFPRFRLNCNGLFDREEDIREYILEREKFEKQHPPYTLEGGGFTVFRLHEIYL